jgi:hypothetical protein
MHQQTQISETKGKTPLPSVVIVVRGSWMAWSKSSAGKPCKGISSSSSIKSVHHKLLLFLHRELLLTLIRP